MSWDCTMVMPCWWPVNSKDISLVGYTKNWKWRAASSVTVRLIKPRNPQATESVTQTFSNETCQESNSEPFLEARIQHFPRKNPFPVAVPRNKSSGFVQGGYQKESTSYSVHPNHSISWCYKAEHSTTNSWCTILPRRWRITNSVQTYKGPTVLCTWSKKSEKDLYNDRYK